MRPLWLLARAKRTSANVAGHAEICGYTLQEKLPCSAYALGAPERDAAKSICRHPDLEHDGFGWNQPNPSCPVEPRSPVRANGMRWNGTRFHLIPFRSRPP
jgi:hypothetical protein